MGERVIIRDDLEDIYRRNVSTIYKVCFLYMKNASDAEDAVQTTFEKLALAKLNFKDDFHERSWLIKVAKNICKNMLGHWSRKNINIDDCELLAVSDAFANCDEELVKKVLSLPEKYNLILFLYYYEGFSTSQLANLLNLNASSVRSRLRRGREKLKLVIEDERSSYEH